MTIEQLNAIAFRFVSHASYSDEHISVYESINFVPIITVKVFVKVKMHTDKMKSRREYYFMGECYRSEKSLLNAINEYFNQNNQENGK